MTNENLDETHPTDTPIGSATDTVVDTTAEAPVDAERSSDTAPQYGVGPFSIREIALVGVWAVAFIVSFFPVNNVVGQAAILVGGSNVWVNGLSWILSIGLPTIAVFLLVLRRLSPQGIRRVGSLGIDQFASVAFSVATLVWLQSVWETVAIAIETGIWVRSWVIWVELFLMLAGVVLTVLAPIIPPFEQDFESRPEVPAHRNARPVRAVVARPKVERPAAIAAPEPEAEPQFSPETYDNGVADTGSYETDVFAPLHDARSEPTTQQWTAADEPAVDAEPVTTRMPAVEEQPAQQAFWALAPVERDVVDEYGRPLFRIGPTAWALVIEDRGPTFVVRHEDGRIGYLHDVTGITRG